MKTLIKFTGKDGKTYSHVVYCDKETANLINEQIGKHSKLLAIYEVMNTVPVWIADLGLVKSWCFMQDIFSFKNPFGGK